MTTQKRKFEEMEKLKGQLEGNIKALNAKLADIESSNL